MSAHTRSGPVVLCIIEALVAGLGRAGAWLCPAMAVLVCVVVVLRRVAVTGGTALQEGVLYLHAAAISVALAYTWQLGGHAAFVLAWGRCAGRIGRLEVGLVPFHQGH